MRWRHLGVNKAALAEAPSPAPSEPDPPTAEEAALMLSEAWASDPDWGLLLWLTMVTGSRRGEVSALRWRHLDLVRGLLAHRTEQRTSEGRRTREGDQDAPAKTRHTRSTDARHARRSSERCEQRCAAAGLRSRTGRVSVLASPGRLDAVAAAHPHPAIRPSRTQTQAAQHQASLAAALLSDRAHRGRCRHPHGRWSARPRQRRGNDAEDLRGMGGRGGPARGGNNGRDHATARRAAGAQAASSTEPSTSYCTSQPATEPPSTRGRQRISAAVPRRPRR